jgi:hypothetical protein
LWVLAEAYAKIITIIISIYIEIWRILIYFSKKNTLNMFSGAFICFSLNGETLLQKNAGLLTMEYGWSTGF